MKHAGIVVLFFVVLVLLMYLFSLPQLSWQAVVAGYIIFVQMLFVVVISKQIELLTDKFDESMANGKNVEQLLSRLVALEEKKAGIEPEAAEEA